MAVTDLAPTRRPPDRPPAGDQQVRFTRAADGTRLAYATHGSGPPLIVVSCWLSHLQHDWRSPVWRHFLDDLGAIATVVRYDERGFGMSDWSVDDFSLDARVADLEAVVAATGLERFALLGMSGGSTVAMAYAARHPDRVTRLVLYGTACGRPPEFDDAKWDEEQTYRSMIRVGWAKEDPLFRRVFTQLFIPGATEEQMRWFDELQRMSTSAENAVQSRVGRQAVDIQHELPRISAPTLVLQALDDRATTFDNAIEVSQLIPGARLVPLESGNHILLADEPAWPVFMAEVRAFMANDRTKATEDEAEAGALVEALSARELDVLRAAADGKSNAEIAMDLGLSARTVERHLSNAYGKLGVGGKSARAAAVAEVLRRNLA
jgi:pimeloyl-ACP methyl ester carboxylesterase/DNA-binding CsgD family transcriptional regulator